MTCAMWWGIKAQFLTRVVHSTLKKVDKHTDALNRVIHVVVGPGSWRRNKEERKKNQTLRLDDLEKMIWKRLPEANGMSGRLKSV